VTTDPKFTVTPWSASQSPIIAATPADKRFLPPAIIGLVGTLLLHAVALQTALTGNQGHKIRAPEIQQPGSSLNKSHATPAESLVFIDLPKTANTNNQIDQSLGYLRAAIKNTPIAVMPPDPSPPLAVETLALDDEKLSASSVDSGDGTERGRLIGIYSGQIQARIERIWRRPRSPVNEHASLTDAATVDESFRCQVQIVQDAKGYVQEVLLPNCNGTFAWQRSLVTAIQQASPLPAPPSPTVFSHSIALSFVGLPYVTGAPEEDYEIAPIKIAQTNSPLPASRPAQAISGLSSSTPDSRSFPTESSVKQETD
jgi:hypothetical protein